MPCQTFWQSRLGVRSREKILAEPSRGVAHSRYDRRSGEGRDGHDCQDADGAGAASRRDSVQTLARAPAGRSIGRCEHRQFHCRTARSRQILPPLPALAQRHADRVRRRTRGCAGRLRRRAARRPGGYRRQAFRRAGRQGVRRDTGRGRNRSAQGLRHQCGQAFQVRAARQAPHPCQARMPARCRPAAGGWTRS